MLSRSADTTNLVQISRATTALILALALPLAGCGGDGVTSTPTPTPTLTPTPTPTPLPTPTPTPTPAPTPTPTPTPSPSPTPVPTPTPTPVPTPDPAQPIIIVPVLPTPTPSPTPSPSPTAPAPPAIPAAYDFPEYRNSAGLAAMDAATAYTAGATGSGVTVGIVDTGILASSPEFAGRISSQSTDATGKGRGIGDLAGHGTAVASIIGAARNGSGSMGVAYQANLLVLRAEQAGSCPECTFADATVAHGIDLAVAAKARVINLSMGSDAIAPSVVTAIRNAAKAGVMVVIAAGNDGADAPSVFAQVASDKDAAGLVLVVGSLDHDAITLSSFSNRAGAWAAYYLAAPGRNVPLLGLDGFASTGSGTSFAAPQVAGAAALLAQAFPNLTGKDIAKILLSTAISLGDKTIAGQGRLSLTNAMKPIGTLSLPDSGTPLAAAGLVQLSPALGDLTLAGGVLDGVVALDSYRRAYRFNLAGQLRPSLRDRPLWPALTARPVQHRLPLGRGAAATLQLITPLNGLIPDADGFAGLRLGRATLGGATFSFRPRANLAVEVGLGGAGAASALAVSAPSPGPLATLRQDALATLGIAARPEQALSARLEPGRLAITGFAEQGYLPVDLPGSGATPLARYRAGGIAVARQWGALRLGMALTTLTETGSLLGSRWDQAYGIRGARTVFVDGRFAWQLTRQWELTGGLRNGWTEAAMGAGLVSAVRLRSSASALAIYGESILRPGDGIALRWERPLQVSRAQFAFAVPVSYSYATQQAGYTARTLSAAPRGREQVLAASYEAELGVAELGATLAWRHQPDNRADLADQWIEAATLRLRW